MSEILRDAEACFSATQALCNHCGRLAEAKIVFHRDKVYLVKWCADHGQTRTMICSDRDWYLRSLAYIKPGQRPLSRAVGAYDGCPDSCGLCPQHLQHTCVPILEITDRCDLDCPICLVTDNVPGELSVDQVRSVLDKLVEYEGKINMLNLSGGEPTLHKDFLKIVDAALRPEIGIVSVATNGVRLAKDEELIKELRDRGVVLSIQFDGVKPETYKALRGRGDLAHLKQKLIERAIALGARISLTTTLARGVNENELPDILRILFENEEVLSLMIQPLFHNGRFPKISSGDLMDEVTIPEVVRRLAESSGGVLKESDFSPMPCSHPSCFAMTYLLKVKEGHLVSLPSVVDADTYLDVVKNQALLSTDHETLLKIKDAMYELWSSGGMVPDREDVLRTIKKILLDLSQVGLGASHRELLHLGMRNVKSIFIHHFMDRYNFDLSRAVKCCNHYPQSDGRLLPACVRNNLGLRGKTLSAP